MIPIAKVQKAQHYIEPIVIMNFIKLTTKNRHLLILD